MRFLITGGAGFIGTNLTKYLVNQGHTVSILDIKKPNFSLQTDCVVGSVCNLKAWTSFYQKEAQFDCLVHLASVVGVKKVTDHRLETITSIVEGTKNALAFALDRCLPIIYFSTSEVYGNAMSPFIEDISTLALQQPCYSRWGYAAAKLCAEHMVLGYHQEMGVKASIVRPFNVTGAGQSGFVLPNFVEAALTNKPIIVKNKGTQSRCFLAVQDAVRAVELLASNLVETGIGNGEVFNLGNPNNKISIYDLAKAIKQYCNSNSEIIEEPEHSLDDIHNRVPDISKIESLLGWHPTRSISKIIESVASSLSVAA